MPINALLQSAEGKAAVTGLLSGAAGGAIAGSLIKNKTAKKVLKTGGLMAMGGLALKAWQHYSDKPAEQPAAGPLDTAAIQSPAGVSTPNLIEQNNNRDALIMIQFMIAAAHADGVLTGDEQSAIWQQAVAAKLAPEELANLSNALNQPCGVSELAAMTQSMEEKIEGFTAAAAVVDQSCLDGSKFLASLEQALQLPSGLSQALVAQVQ